MDFMNTMAMWVGYAVIGAITAVVLYLIFEMIMCWLTNRAQAKHDEKCIRELRWENAGRPEPGPDHYTLDELQKIKYWNWARRKGDVPEDSHWSDFTVEELEQWVY